MTMSTGQLSSRDDDRLSASSNKSFIERIRCVIAWAEQWEHRRASMLISVVQHETSLNGLLFVYFTFHHLQPLTRLTNLIRFEIDQRLIFARIASALSDVNLKQTKRRPHLSCSTMPIWLDVQDIPLFLSSSAASTRLSPILSIISPPPRHPAPEHIFSMVNRRRGEQVRREWELKSTPLGSVRHLLMQETSLSNDRHSSSSSSSSFDDTQRATCEWWS